MKFALASLFYPFLITTSLSVALLKLIKVKLNLFLLAEESAKSWEHQRKDKVIKVETGFSEEQVETLKQVSSLVAMFQQEALNEKQTRLLAQLKALEKVLN